MKKKKRLLRIATKYPNLTRQFLYSKGVTQFQLVQSLGSTEVAPYTGTAEVISDITSSGTTLKANKMFDETHIRLTLTRGEKITSGMNPKLNQKGCTLIILAEWKPSIYSGKKLKLVTANIRRNSPLCLDSKIHHNNLINNILAKIEANNANVDDAIMLDLYGFVAETNATNIFMIKNGTIYTPFADACLPGITRGLIIKICQENNIPVFEKNISDRKYAKF